MASFISSGFASRTRPFEQDEQEEISTSRSKMISSTTVEITEKMTNALYAIIKKHTWQSSSASEFIKMIDLKAVDDFPDRSYIPIITYGFSRLTKNQVFALTDLSVYSKINRTCCYFSVFYTKEGIVTEVFEPENMAFKHKVMRVDNKLFDILIAPVAFSMLQKCLNKKT
tara:strand:- start:255 stop:764 length:510 start_codon:yes stop_codon:yes gene_type:complete